LVVEAKARPRPRPYLTVLEAPETKDNKTAYSIDILIAVAYAWN